MVGAAFLALIAGYLVGSFHPLTAAVDRLVQFTDVVADSFQTTEVASAGIPKSPGQSEDVRLVGLPEPEDNDPPDRPLRSLGEEFVEDGFSVALTDVHLKERNVSTSSRGSIRRSEEVTLICSLRVTNNDAQNVLQIRQSNATALNLFTIAGSQVNNFRALTSLSGRKDPKFAEEILPGEQQTYSPEFSLPSLKVERLLLTVDLQAIGGHGRVSFAVPVKEIRGIPADS